MYNVEIRVLKKVVHFWFQRLDLSQIYYCEIKIMDEIVKIDFECDKGQVRLAQNDLSHDENVKIMDPNDELDFECNKEQERLAQNDLSHDYFAITCIF